MLIIFGISSFIIFYAMVGYPATLELLDKLFKPDFNKKNYNYLPSVCLMVVAHNEEEVIERKLENAISLDYPINKFEIIVASDNSTDKTNKIVEKFILEHKEYKIKLIVTKEHKGKTNAQNEAQKFVTSEILVMTDANTFLKLNAVKELVSSFSDESISYVCGKLVYTNTENLTNNSETSYWNYDLRMRDIESRFQTITAGNGALYACRNKDYIDIESIFCHDSMFPFLFALQNKKSIFNPDAVAYEKTGSNNSDELKRKIRMNRDILTWIKLSFKTFDIRKYKWFSLFFFGHRFCRYCLWFAHILAFISSLIATVKGKKWGKYFTVTQLFIGIIAVVSLKFGVKEKLFRMIGYYVMTIYAQVVGVKNIILGKSKAVWESVGNTRK